MSEGLPFGYDEVPAEPINVPVGEYDCIVRSVEAYKSTNSGNPVVRWHLKVLDPIPEDVRYWDIRTFTALRGKGAGMFKGLVSGCGVDADELMDDALSLYEGDGDAEDVAEFFNAAILPQLVDLPISVRITIKPSVRDGVAQLDDEGNQYDDTAVKAFKR